MATKKLLTERQKREREAAVASPAAVAAPKPVTAGGADRRDYLRRMAGWPSLRRTS